MESRDLLQEDQADAVIATTAVCLAIATFMVSIRMYTRIFLVRQVGPDDYMAIITLVLIYGVGVGMALNTSNGLGRHISTLDDSSLLHYRSTFYATLILYTAALLAVKTTLLTQYYRLFSVQSMRSLYLAAFTLVLTWSLSQVLLAAFACVPVAAFWDAGVEGARCLPPAPLLYANAAGNIATEVAVLALPLPVLGALNLPRSQRFMLIGIFSLGFLTVLISIIRIRHLDNLSDYTYQTVTPACLSLAELTTALTCACLLTLRPVITRAAPSSQASQFRHEHKRGSYLRHSDASTFVVRSESYSSSSSGQQQQQQQVGTPPRRGSAAVRYLASMESREGLYDDKYMLTASSYELENFPTPPAQAVILDPEKNTPMPHRPFSSDSTNPLASNIQVHKPDAMRKPSNGRWGRSFATKSEKKKKKLKASAGNKEWTGDSGTVKTEIDNKGVTVNHKGKPTPKWEIGVQTTVYVTYQSTYTCTAGR